MPENLPFLLKLLHDPNYVRIECVVCIVGYYVVTFFAIRALKNKIERSVWRKNGPLDIITSIIWVLMPAILIFNIIHLATKNEFSLSLLLEYYVYFLFLFAFLYCMAEWHFPDSLYEADSGTWKDEIKYLIISVQTQTNLGYTRARPNNLLTEIIACLQALIALFFAIVFVAKAVNKLP